MDDLCAAADKNSSFLPLVLIQWIQLSLSILSIFVLLRLFRNFHQIKLLLHVNFKIVLTAAGFVYLFHSVILLSKNVYSLFIDEECHGVLVRWKCLFYAGPIAFSTIAFCISHVVVCVERGFATLFLHSYERKSKHFGFALVAGGTFLCVGWSYYIFRDDDLYSYAEYCMASTPTSGSKILSSLYCLLFLDICVTVCDFYFYWLAKRRLRKRFTRGGRRDNSYQLSGAFQMRENELVISLVFPLTVVHSVCFICYLLVSSTLRTVFHFHHSYILAATSIEGSHSVLCVYELVTLIMLLVLHGRLCRHKLSRVSPMEQGNQGDLYFKLLAQQI